MEGVLEASLIALTLSSALELPRQESHYDLYGRYCSAQCCGLGLVWMLGEDRRLCRTGRDGEGFRG